MKRGPYKQGATGGLRLVGRPMKQIGPPNLYAHRKGCKCGPRALVDTDGICAHCGHTADTTLTTR